MTYHPSHPYRDGDESSCVHPTPGDRVPVCARREEHPIHEVDQPIHEKVASSLARHQWRDDPVPQLREMSAHENHEFDSECAVCTGDVHRIAAFLIDRWRPYRWPGPPPISRYGTGE